MFATDTFTNADLRRWFSSHTLAKGAGYLQRVSALHVGERQITAQVSGTAARPYQVQIELAKQQGIRPARLLCSCPVGGHCKHVAATLLAVLNQRSFSVDEHGATRIEYHAGEVASISPAATHWLSKIQHTARLPDSPRRAASKSEHAVWMVGHNPANELRVGIYKARLDKAGNYAGKFTPWSSFHQAYVRPPAFFAEDDLAVLELLMLHQRGQFQVRQDLPLKGWHSQEIVKRLLATNRCFWNGAALQPLRHGKERPARLEWQQDAEGRFCIRTITEEPVTAVLSLDPPWYVDVDQLQMGELRFEMPPAVTSHMLNAPALSEAEAALAARVLAEAVPAAPLPRTTPVRVLTLPPTPMLCLQSLDMWHQYPPLGHYDSLEDEMVIDAAALKFRYGDAVFSVNDRRTLATLADGELVQIQRDHHAESASLRQLHDSGFEPLPSLDVEVEPQQVLDDLLVLANDRTWLHFIAVEVPRLQARGWEVVMLENFRHHYAAVDEWVADIAETENGWFELDMGIVVDGQRLPLAPLLADLFLHDERWLDKQQVAQIADDEMIPLFTSDGRSIQTNAARLKPLALTLMDIVTQDSEGKPLLLSNFDAVRLNDAVESGWRVGGEGLLAVQRMAKRILGLGAVPPVIPPRGLTIQLRQYQLEGLAWLQYLREHELGGILADDMGLGKTMQALAHLLLEQQHGRLDKPALIVLPTSLIFNWKQEAARFAPSLRVLPLHGKDRGTRFDDIASHDLVLTTYPLLWRDAAALQKHHYSFLILDEAQMVKNAASKAAAVVRQLHARHRLCITGTPLENHLGELWSQFDFLLPGFLGDSRAFTKMWRNPIEKHGDSGRAALLAQRVRPFILRRRKDDVAKELPRKTIIVRSVELEAGQRDLYELVRSTMSERVRNAIASRGFARSHIVMLDALLKLRQVCCDPRLVKSAAASKVKERAKLAMLMTMLPELVEEGRKILVFSQFTSMLELIEQELDKEGIDYALLTGDTVDREQQIMLFQSGAVPIFLISLKAGGVGLNLTAADTVIHYDPWWNPAVENQATDRAHRLGQNKPVFVYKLVVAGSIEEKIVALQERKAELAESVLSDDAAGELKFSETDIQALLAPLPPI